MGHHNLSGRATVIGVRRSWTLMASSSVERVENKNVQEKRANERAEERERISVSRRWHATRERDEDIRGKRERKRLIERKKNVGDLAWWATRIAAANHDLQLTTHFFAPVLVNATRLLLLSSWSLLLLHVVASVVGVFFSADSDKKRKIYDKATRKKVQCWYKRWQFGEKVSRLES